MSIIFCAKLSQNRSYCLLRSSLLFPLTHTFRGHEERLDRLGRQQLSTVGLWDRWVKYATCETVSDACGFPSCESELRCCRRGAGKQLALLNTNSAVRTCGFDFSGNIIMFSTDKQMGYQCFLNFFDLRDPQQIGTWARPRSSSWILLLKRCKTTWQWHTSTWSLVEDLESALQIKCIVNVIYNSPLKMCRVQSGLFLLIKGSLIFDLNFWHFYCHWLIRDLLKLTLSPF